MPLPGIDVRVLRQQLLELLQDERIFFEVLIFIQFEGFFTPFFSLLLRKAFARVPPTVNAPGCQFFVSRPTLFALGALLLFHLLLQNRQNLEVRILASSPVHFRLSHGKSVSKDVGRVESQWDI